MRLLPKTERFPWTGTCTSCQGPSNPYNFGNQGGDQKPSRCTVWVRGSVKLANGETRKFKAKGERIEICYACKCRWRRKKTFAMSGAGRPGNYKKTEQVQAMLQAGLSISAISRALRRPYSTMHDQVRKLQLKLSHASSPTPRIEPASTPDLLALSSTPALIPTATPS